VSHNASRRVSRCHGAVWQVDGGRESEEHKERERVSGVWPKQIVRKRSVGLPEVEKWVVLNKEICV